MTKNKETKTTINEEDVTMENVVVSREQIWEDALNRKISKSEAFKQLFSTGMTVGQISKLTGSHYSFVYGVVQTAPGFERKANGPSRSDQIRELAAQGLTPGAIAKAINANYSFVHSVVKRIKQTTE